MYKNLLSIILVVLFCVINFYYFNEVKKPKGRYKAIIDMLIINLAQFVIYSLFYSLIYNYYTYRLPFSLLLVSDYVLLILTREFNTKNLEKTLSLKFKLIVMSIPIITMILLMVIVSQNQRFVVNIISIFVIMLIDLFIIGFIIELKKNIILFNDNIQLNNQIIDSQIKYESMEKSYNDIRKIKHDMANNLLSINYMLQNKEYENVLE